MAAMQRRTRFALEVASDLLDAAMAIRAQRHRREHPEASEEEVARVVDAWVKARPGATDGDAEGRWVSIPRQP